MLILLLTRIRLIVTIIRVITVLLDGGLLVIITDVCPPAGRAAPQAAIICSNMQATQVRGYADRDDTHTFNNSRMH
jgi:hypothetical protein